MNLSRLGLRDEPPKCVRLNLNLGLEEISFTPEAPATGWQIVNLAARQRETQIKLSVPARACGRGGGGGVRIISSPPVRWAIKRGRPAGSSAAGRAKVTPIGAAAQTHAHINAH